MSEKISIGCDIESVERFEEKIQDKSFLNTIFTKNEQEYCKRQINSAQHLAARFCAKEATIKALTSFNLTEIKINEIEIYHDKNKVPMIRLLNEYNDFFDIKTSLSHNKDKSLAFVVAEKVK